MSSQDLKDRIAVVTGGARGIGLETAKALSQAGAILVWPISMQVRQRPRRGSSPTPVARPRATVSTSPIQAP